MGPLPSGSPSGDHVFVIAPGRLVVLNGTSSAGKTTLASAFRDERAAAGEFWLLVGIDDVLSKLPAQWLDLGLEEGTGVKSGEGMRFESTGDGLRLRIGSVCRQLLDVYHRSVATAVLAGLNVIVDDVVVDRATLESWRRTLDGLNPTWVAVRFAGEIASRRERERGDRPIGMAAAQQDTIHHDIDYDFEIDTGILRPAEAHRVLNRGLGLADSHGAG